MRFKISFCITNIKCRTSKSKHTAKYAMTSIANNKELPISNPLKCMEINNDKSSKRSCKKNRRYKLSGNLLFSFIESRMMCEV